jgi:hypothetical protein
LRLRSNFIRIIAPCQDDSRKRMTMENVEYTRVALEEAGNVLGDAGPVHMVNMVRYRDQADYRGNSDLPPCSGREAYFQRYAPAFNKLAQGEDYGLFWVGSVRGMLVSPHGQAWDDIVIALTQASTHCVASLRARPMNGTPPRTGVPPSRRGNSSQLPAKPK